MVLEQHTIIIDDVPVLPLSAKNEARRLITLLDALCEPPNFQNRLRTHLRKEYWQTNPKLACWLVRTLRSTRFSSRTLSVLRPRLRKILL